MASSELTPAIPSPTDVPILNLSEAGTERRQTGSSDIC